MSDRRQFIKSLATIATVATLGRPARGQEVRVRTVAGTGTAGYQLEGSGGSPAAQTPVNNPYGIVKGPDDALYFCEVDTGRTRRLDLQSNRITTIAGTGEAGYAGDGGPALQAMFSAPHEIRFDPQGNLYIVERDAHVVRRVDAVSGQVTTLAGTGTAGFSGDNGPAHLAQLRQPHSIALTSNGDLLICDIGNSRVRTVDLASSVISTAAGNGERAATPDSGLLEDSPLMGPRSIDSDSAGNAYLVLREGNAVFRLDLADGRLQRIAGTGERGYSGDGSDALDCTFNGPKGIAYSAPNHSLYIVDTENHVIRCMDLNTSRITTVLGTGEPGDGGDGAPLQCALNRPHGVCVHNNIIYVTDSENHRIRAIEGQLLA